MHEVYRAETNQNEIYGTNFIAWTSNTKRYKTSVSIFGYEKCRRNNSKMEVHKFYIICVYCIQLLAQKVKKLLDITLII
jgi:hypothetical protein